MPEWYDRARRRVFFDMHLPDWTEPGQSGGHVHESRGVASAFDPERIIAQFVRAGVNAAVIFAKCQYGNFYCDIPGTHKHPGLGDLDFLGEMIRLGHRHNIRIIGYYSNRWDVHIAHQHPEWMQHDAHDHVSYDRWPALCLNSPYRDVVHEHLRALFTRYDLDGVWSDIVHGQPCYSPYCEARFQAATGQLLPRSSADAGYLDWLRWQHDYLDDYIAGCREVVKALKPDAAFILNYFGTTYTHPREGLYSGHLRHSDLGSTEGYTEWHGLLFPGYAARYMRMGTLDRPFEVLIGRFVNTWDFTVRPAAQTRFEAFSIAANGGAVCLDDEPYHDGTIEPSVYDGLADAYAEIARREPYLFGAQPVYYAALYHSEKSRELDTILNGTPPAVPALIPPSNANPGASDLLPGLMGAYKALLDAHIPVQFVDDRPESLATLARYKVVYLANILALTDAEADALRAFVAAGGGLVATGATSLFDADGSERVNFRLADLFGVDAQVRDGFTFPYFHFTSAPFTGELRGAPLPHYTALWRVKLNAPDVQIAATRRDPLIETGGEVYYHNNQPAPGPDTGEAAITYRRYGAGRVVYCAGLPESNYARLGLPRYRQLIANMIAWAAGEAPPISADGLPYTEIVPTTLGSDWIVHLVTGIPQRAVRFGLNRTADTIETRAELRSVRLLVRARVRAAERLPQGEPLIVTPDADGTIVELPAGTDWETLRLVFA